MAWGRPLKFKSAKEIKKFAKFPWKEKQLCDYLEDKIKEFCLEVLDEEYVSHKREWYFWLKRFWWNTMSIDFMVETKNGLILLEVKNPTAPWSEMASAIWQSLVYRSHAEYKWYDVYRNIILTTRTTVNINGTIVSMKLPIELIVIQEDLTYVLENED